MPLQNVDSVVKRLQISISNVLSVSAYNTLTTKPTLKIFYWKMKCNVFPNKKFNLPIFNPDNRTKIVLIYANVSSKFISLIKRRIEYLNKALLARFATINVFKV